MISARGATRALLALVTATLLLQALARPSAWSRDILAEDDELELAYAEPAASTSTEMLGIGAAATCPSAVIYKKTKKGCLCKKGYGTFVFGWDRSSANPKAKRYPSIFPSACRYYKPGTSTKMSFPTSQGRCFCFACPVVNGVKYKSPGVGFLNSYSSGCYKYQYFYARVHLLNTTCQALTSDRIKYNQVKSAITKVFQDRFKQINNTFSPVVNQFKCANGPNNDAYISFRLGYLGPFADAQNQIISDVLTSICQRTKLCDTLSPLLPPGSTISPIGEANPTPLPQVPGPAPGSSPGPAPGTPSPAPAGTPSPGPGTPTGPSPNPPLTISPAPGPTANSPNPPATASPAPVPPPIPPPATQVCAPLPLPLGGQQCGTLIAQNSACQESNFLDPLDAANLALLQPILGTLGLLGGTLDLANLNTITEQACVGVLCPTLSANNPSFALYAPSTLGLPIGGLRCKCYGFLSSSTCTKTAGVYDIYQYQGGSTGGPGSSPAPTPGPLGPIGNILPILPITSLTSIFRQQGDCSETPVASPTLAGTLPLLGLSLISNLDQCVNACSLVQNRTYASYSSVLATNLLPTCKCFTSATCSQPTCGLLNCLLSSFTVYKYT